MSEAKETKKISHWTKKQRVKYELFILVQAQKMTSPGYNVKKEAPFKMLSKWMKNEKSADQCRDHHKKRIKMCSGSLSLLVEKIIRENYKERKVSTKHFEKELQTFLTQVLQDKKIEQDQYYNLLKEGKVLAEKYSWDQVIDFSSTSISRPTFHSTPLKSQR